ncbi:MAG: UDP-3-O-(3-hydroxymyristoyl)glucosamine N-acyltransferase [Bryobacterales bacterium]|nr:UDP-3-O-(3-hydroxymyristoyl)glucosamine N-acyltransferase [Bryobacterales bacterium]
MRVSDLALRLQAPFEGVGDLEIQRALPVEEAGPADLAFASGRKGVVMAASSLAGCLIVDASFPAGRTLIRVPDPRTAFAMALMILYPPKKYTPGIHPTAVVHPSASIADEVHIGPHAAIGEHAVIGQGSVIGAGCCIGDGASIGPNCLLHPRVTIYDGVRVGARAILHSGAVLGADGFGFVRVNGAYQKFPQVGTVELGDDCEIGANSTIDRAALGVTRLGNGVKLDNMVHIGHNCRIDDHVVIAAQTGMSGGCVIEAGAVIGGQVGMGDKVRVESGAVLGSGSGVLTSKIVRGGDTYWGTPARPLKEYLRQLAHMANLPKLAARVKELEKRTEDPSI